MILGSTPTHIFNIPINTAEIEDLKITYAQNDKVILKKCKSDCTLNDNTITTTLAEKETLLFNCKLLVEIQLKIKTTSGNVLASDIIRISAGKCLDKETFT